MIEWKGGDFLGARGVVLQRSFYDCGPAALANLFTLMGVRAPSLDSIARLAGTTPRGTSLGALARVGSHLGHEFEVRRYKPAKAPNEALPVIACAVS